MELIVAIKVKYPKVGAYPGSVSAQDAISLVKVLRDTSGIDQ